MGDMRVSSLLTIRFFFSITFVFCLPYAYSSNSQPCPSLTACNNIHTENQQPQTIFVLIFVCKLFFLTFFFFQRGGGGGGGGYAQA